MFSASSPKYSSVADNELCDYDDRKIPRSHSTHILPALLILSLVANVFLSAKLLYQSPSCRAVSDMGQLLYSPAAKALQHEPLVFRGDFGLDSSPYSGVPDEASNSHWQALYDFGISRISTDEARDLVNKTLPIPDDHGYYITSLSVFHQLHCLNNVRLAVYNGTDWTDQDELMAITHVDHCINAIRQSLMCSADITPLVWGRRSLDERAKEVMEVEHSCRNFEAVKRWAADRQLRTNFDFTAIVEDDPLQWGAWTL
ncbi:hypothetical protein M409DRAFT_18008 [Zasmidium cellare ATCC 36951]|uniref:Tat pathway signal sequence n=1 Tax=Zasmidium cellare ATCC 36951 TaxID=1080233 RepID=A0A6A6CX92_ZASCE|nr:uncharacterized protein M409DRAFT_18008 [Zasmidium cellare ATCC 36951]KAF2171774.1 hypothetical protein M409DRAFT_18008 [Zasmidium cellare ATCC 36951]